MEKTVVRNNYVEELVNLIRSDLDKEELLEQISNYHENDIADALEKLSEDERKKLYPILGAKRISEIFSYLEENTRQYFDELSVESAAKVISLMDSDDAVDVLEHLEDSKRKEIVKKLEELGNLVKTEEYKHNVGKCERCKNTIEPKISTQWFVKMKELAEPAIKAVKENDIKFVPKRYEKTYFNCRKYFSRSWNYERNSGKK